ncbi:hypothetical protein L3X38_026729 [Prunus dulcis]|uniref:Uncharacterized protein n=2 Tax=Prunus dulcis TaxID=3755 RepID=A0AAD4VLQ4_PRUDU|nr:hypothetical protein L3X38_026729 [Prunus dulcis]
MPQRGNLCAARWGYKCWVFEAERWRGGMRRKKKKSVSFGGDGGKQQLLLLAGGREAASITSVGYRLIAKSHEVQEENEKLSKMVDFYSKNLQKQLEALENPRKHKGDHERSSREMCAIFGGSSDEP